MPETSSWNLTTRLWRDWVRPHWRVFASAVVFMVLVAATSGALPHLVKLIMERFAETPETAFILIPAVIGVQLVRGGSMYLQTVLMSVLSQRTINDLQKAMFSHLTFADFARLGREATGTLVSRFTNDVNQLRTSMTKIATSLFRDVLTLVALFGYMLWTDWLMTLLILVCYPVVLLPINRLGKRLRKVSKQTQEQIGDITASLHESLSAARMVKVYRLEERENARAGKAFDKRYKLIVKAVRNRSAVPPMLEIVAGLAVALIVSVAGWQISQGNSTTGEFAGLLTALLLTSQPIRSLGQLHMALQKSGAALQRIFDVVDEPPSVRQRENTCALASVRQSVRLENVTFAYGENDAPALCDVSLEARAGEFIALVGPSGAGKSTVFNLLPRLYDPTAGAVLIDGADIRDLTIESLRDHLALVSQEATLFNDTIRENIRFGKLEADEAAIERAARAADADEFIRTFPNGYDTVVGDRGTRLSGGQRQRIAIARAILKDAPVLLLDEATSALDSEAEKRVQHALDRLRQGRTTFAIAHRLATVCAADRIVVLDGGRVIETGTHDELAAKNGTYARLCKLQFGNTDLA